MGFSIRSAGTNHSRVSDSSTGGASVRVAGVWKDGKVLYERVSGVWKVFHSPDPLVPSSDVSESGFEDTTGGDGDGVLWDEVSDGSLSTYLYSTLTGAGTNYARFNLPDAGVPHTLDQTVRLSVKCRPITTSTHNAFLNVKLYQGVTLVDGDSDGLTAQFTLTPAMSGADQAFSYDLTSTERSDLSPWTSMDLRLEHVVTSVALDTYHLRVYAAKLFIDF